MYLACFMKFIIVFIFADIVLGGGPGVRGRQELVLDQEVLWCGLFGERQPSEVLFYPCLWYQGELSEIK